MCPWALTLIWFIWNHFSVVEGNAALAGQNIKVFQLAWIVFAVFYIQKLAHVLRPILTNQSKGSEFRANQILNHSQRGWAHWSCAVLSPGSIFWSVTDVWNRAVTFYCYKEILNREGDWSILAIRCFHTLVTISIESILLADSTNIGQHLRASQRFLSNVSDKKASSAGWNQVTSSGKSCCLNILPRSNGNLKKRLSGEEQVLFKIFQIES